MCKGHIDVTHPLQTVRLRFVCLAYDAIMIESTPRLPPLSKPSPITIKIIN